MTHPKEVVKEGDVLTLRVIRVDAQRRRIGLSLKQVASGEYAEADWQAEYEAGLAEEEEGEPELPEYAEEQEGQEEPVAQAAEEVEEAAVEADSEGEDLPAESEVEDVSAAPDPEPVTVDHLVTEPAPLVMDQIAV